MTQKQCTSCQRNPTNDGFSCVPLMSDGRLFTNWRPRCAQTYLDIQGKQVSSYEGRQHLITNAVDLMKNNAADAYVKARCSPCYENPDWNTGTMLNEQYIQVCNKNGCQFVLKDKNGLGLGRQYWDSGVEQQSDYKNKFLSLKKQEQDWFKGHLQGVSDLSSDYMPVSPAQ